MFRNQYFQIFYNSFFVKRFSVKSSRLQIKKIKAFDKNGKKIVLKNTLSEWGELCKEKYFVRCHRSYLVNMRYVKVYSRTEFEMKNEDIVPIGRKYEKQTREIWNLHKMEEEV